MSAPGKSVRLFLADGTPGGLVTAEIMNWTGHVIAAPRSDLATLLSRPETSRTGIYVLLGDDPDAPGGTVAYVGEGDDVGKRLAAHHREEASGGKDFWDRVVVLTSKDANLTKAHARFLESRLIAIATEASRGRLVNVTAPPPLALPEADASDMEFFIEQAKIVLPVLGINLLRSTRPQTSMVPPPAIAPTRDGASTSVPAEPRDASSSPGSPLFSITGRGAHATAQYVDGEFIVRAGSTVAPRVGVMGSYERLRQQLTAQGSLTRVESGAVRFTRDVPFSSVSAAATVVLGSSANGRKEWRIESSGLTLGAWQARSVGRTMGGA